jgi:hypothetical protein
MKKLLVIISALIVAAACAAPSTNRESMPANTNSAATSPTAALSEADAIAKEKATWAALEKKDMDAFANMLASDYVEVRDQVYDKASDLEDLKNLELSSADFSDWKVTNIDKDAVLLMYNVTVKATTKGQEVPPGPYRASSVWVNRDGKWLAAYYQETLARTAPPPPPPVNTPAKSSASPAAKAADVTAAADPVAREKMVWDALKRKDYDTFASFLDEAQMEVEADGVTDKAGTLKGVHMFDASKWELSDFKTASFDSDASLVTYLVKSTDPKVPQERHSTIWVRRDGKWRALFHQGTPAMPSAPESAASPAAHASPSPAMKAPAKKM